MSTIFLSYRRDDSAATCGRIYERLAAHFGRDAVFKDVDDIPYGVRFPDYLAERLSACRLELVIIGKQWLTLTTDDGIRRLDTPGDFVRIEIETGLHAGLILVPVLVDNATMPHAETLPESIRELVEYHGADVHYDPYFDTDMQRLIRQLERWLGVPPPPQPAPSLPPDPQAALLARLVPGIRDAYALRNWDVVFEKADLLTSEVPAGSVPSEVWRMLGEARAQTGDPAAAATYFKRALALADAPDERLPLLRDYTTVLITLEQWDELLRRADEGSRLAPGDVFWLRARLRALTALRRAADALALVRTLTSRPDATAADWLTCARLVRAVDGKTPAADAEAQSALDAAARLAGPNDPTIAAIRRELFPPPPPPPLAPEDFPTRLATLGFVPRTGEDPQTGKEIAYIVPPTVPVRAGPFQMGSDPKRDRDTQSDEPLHTVNVPAFAIARYPVTVAEYACFARAGQPVPSGWQDQLREKLDHPVVYVSWHDATAYAAWLARLSGQPWRLPDEEEWEKAARWDPRTGASRIYPWGDIFDANRCNTRESGIGTTTPIGKYGAAGTSPCGAEDMAGNVWEWTSSFYSYTANNRVLRGGSWIFEARYARAASRDLGGPDSLTGLRGFRLDLAPVRPGS